MIDGYNTRQKQQVLSALIDAGARAVTVDELFEALKERGQAVGKTTVYRQLERLVENGAARKDQSREGATLYQYVGDASACDKHLHCQCELCGRLMHVDCVRLFELASHLMEDHGFRLNAERTVLMGRCADCEEAPCDGTVDA